MFSRPRRIITTTTGSTDPRLKTSWFQPSDETLREQELILANMFFLVRQGDAFGERLKCVECGNRHDYITLKCIEKPITGIANGLYAYYRAIKDHHLEAELPPSQQSRLAEIQQMLQNMPDLGKVHPELARKVVQQIGPSDLQLGAVSLGLLEPISPTEARRKADKINETGIRPKFVLGVPNRAEVDRALEYRGTPLFSRDRW